MFFKNLFKKKIGGSGKELLERIANNMVLIPPGSFLMGSNAGEDNERPVHNVLVDGIYMGKYVVTQKEWYEIMDTKPWQNAEYKVDGDDYPVVNVSWYDAQQYIKKINKLTKKKFRLPGEAEWEYACRAGSTTKFFHGPLKLGLTKYAWYYDNSFKKGEMYTHEVGKKKPNKWGLFDMLGNVYEWCSDWYNRNYYNKSPLHNPRGPSYGKGKIVRGGDWARTDYFLRVSARRYYHIHYKDSHIGFRIVIDLLDQRQLTSPFNNV